MLAVALTLSVSCSDDSSSPPPSNAPPPATYQGVLVGSGSETGTVTLVLTYSALAAEPHGRARAPGSTVSPERTAATVAGTLRIGAGTISVTGAFDEGTSVLTASGGGYSLAGILASGELTGSYTRTGGSGYFVAVQPTTTVDSAWCGAWTGTISGGGTDLGTVALMIDAQDVIGVAVADGGARGSLAGDYNTATADILCTFTLTPGGAGYTLTGTAGATQASGTYSSSLGGGSAGTWTTTPCPF
jgi:hypothetical protein